MNFSIENLIALLTLTLMEIVLGIDNIIFIAILVAKVPHQMQFKARTMGLTMALVFRIGLLFSLNWIMGLTEPLFSILEKGFSGRDLLLLGGGLFLVAKSTLEIHEKISETGHPAEKKENEPHLNSKKFVHVIFQIMLIDIVFSLDSVITAVGMVQNLPIMITAVVISMFIMLGISGPIGDFIEKNPTIKILALSFLIMIGVMLLMEGMGSHVSKGYIYFAMAFAFGVEMINLRVRKNS